MYGVGKTDIGIVRTNNEDSIFVANEKTGPLNNLYIVSDGMGGHNGGEVASSKGIEFFIEFIKKNSYDKGDLLDYLADALRFSNQNIFEISSSNNALSGMGATFVGCTIENGKCFIVHIGDSRLYIINKNNLSQITMDHTYVNELVKAGQITEEQAEKHHLKNIVTRALGTEKCSKIDGILYEIKKDDTILICSDGLSNKVSEEEIVRIISKEIGLIEKADNLIEIAKKNGGDDNISVILIDSEEVGV